MGEVMTTQATEHLDQKPTNKPTTWASTKEAAANPETTMSAKERAAKPGPWAAVKEAASGPENYISVKETAAFLSIPLNTCYKLFLSRTLPSYKFGKLRRAKISDIVAYMEDHRIEAGLVR